MFTVLFENDRMLKECSFSPDLPYQDELKLLKRKGKDLNLDLTLLKPNVLFIDFYNSTSSLIEKIKSIREIDTRIKLVLLVDYYSDHFCWIAKKFSLNGIIKKNMNTDEFVKNVSTIIEDLNNTNCMYHTLSIEQEIITKILTKTELTVFKLIGKGFTSIEISNCLNLSKRTIDTHRANIHKKMGCKNSTKLIYAATAYNILNIF